VEAARYYLNFPLFIAHTRLHGMSCQKEEKEIVKSFEDGEWKPVQNLSDRKKALMQYARQTLRKDKRLNIRISEKDLVELQRKALREGQPYQTFVASIIHKFINGQLVEEKK
jgi:predicted DNA binding CopG/RHH family protein